ncbi:Protein DETOXIFICATION 34, partial [Mucuna pruriens]
MQRNRFSPRLEKQKRVERKSAKIGEGNEKRNGGESSSSSSDENSPRSTRKGETPFFNGLDPMDTTELHHAPEGLVDTNGGDYVGIDDFTDIQNVFSVESVKLWAIAGPIAFSILCNYAVNSFTNIFVGHLGDLELSAVSISLSVVSNFSFGFLLGMASALETLCGQAFGAGQVEMLGVYMQRSWLILLGACICLLPIYIYSERILILLGQEREIAELAGVFTIQSIPQMFSLAINFPTQKFLQAQTKVGFLAWLGFGALIIHIIILYILIKVYALGTSGAAAAYCITAWIIALAQTAYVIGWCKDGWRGFSWLAFKDLWSFVKLSVASAIMLCLEVWYFMILIVLTGHLDNPIIAVGSLSICMNVNGWEGMLFIGINAAISVRVSNELGSGRPRAAKYSVMVTIVQSLIIGLICAGLILITKDQFAIIFTDSTEMIKAVSNLAGLLGITMILNSVQPVISGVAVGGGWQALVAYINLFCYYVMGLPLGFVFGYKLGYRVEVKYNIITQIKTNQFHYQVHEAKNNYFVFLLPLVSKN